MRMHGDYGPVPPAADDDGGPELDAPTRAGLLVFGLLLILGAAVRRVCRAVLRVANGR